MTEIWNEAWARRGVTEDAWREFVDDVAERLQVRAGDRVFAVGGAAGAFLSPFYEVGISVGGLDTSEARIAAARRLMPEGQWIVGDAAALDPAESAEVVVACGSFPCFPDHEYARGVLARMAAKATRALAILDVPDLDFRQEALGERLAMRPGGLEAPLDQGRDHLDFERMWFVRMLDQMGVSGVEISSQRIEGDRLSAFRFNVFAPL